MAESSKCVKKVVAPYDPTEKLSLVLSFAEEHLPEGQYLIVAEALKKAHSTTKPPKPEPYRIKNVKLDLVISCKDKNSSLHLKSFVYKMYAGATPNDCILTYRITSNGQESEYKEKDINHPHSEMSNNELMQLVKMFLVISNSTNVELKMPDFKMDWDYKSTLQSIKEKHIIHLEVDEIDDEDDCWDWGIGHYHNAIIEAVSSIVRSTL